MNLIRRNPFIAVMLISSLMILLLTSMEFSGSYAWVVVKLDDPTVSYDDSYGVDVDDNPIPVTSFMMGEVNISADDDDQIINDSTIPILLRARVIIELFDDLDEPISGANYYSLVDVTAGWTVRASNDGGIFIVYDDSNPIQPNSGNIAKPTVSLKAPLDSGFTYTISYIYEAIQATPDAIVQWEGDYE